jgi:hypothetical protein
MIYPVYGYANTANTTDKDTRFDFDSDLPAKSHLF